jgi:hypothetical protein
MKLVTIEQHPFRSGVFDKFIEGMKVDAECRASIRRAAYAYHFNMPGVCGIRSSVRPLH